VNVEDATLAGRVATLQETADPPARSPYYGLDLLFEAGAALLVALALATGLVRRLRPARLSRA
jgi:hypothetical protein